ncbi:bifunctional metallophosphatase/5'-nucleotidase [Undibacterium sp. SXout20W]|uniref:bifunctional metallophosphatase/5'-nucleotidase n=1 Tax=Undibacterium sp. SXout20W TaxID=3413051 RepID=UPI003BF261B1
MNAFQRISSLMILAGLSACSTSNITNSERYEDITIFSINDFHGNLQSDQPVPYFAVKPDQQHPGQEIKVPAGGYAYLASKLKERRAAVHASILVGAGDLMGASPMGSALLKDEPVIEALNEIGLSVTAVGNHEFDRGTEELTRKLDGACPVAGCSFAGFHGAKYEYLGANVLRSENNMPWLKPYVIRQVGTMKIGFIGAVTADVPNLVAGDAVKQLRFDDEATAINRYVPELQKQGVNAIVVLIHEGAMYKGNDNDPTYRCEGLQGPIIEISKKLDKAISLVVSGHSHQGYTCKIDGRLVVQGRSYGAFLTESTLTIDKQTQQVIKAVAMNHLIDQQQIVPDATAQKLVKQVADQTAAMRLRPIVRLNKPLLRDSDDQHFDSSFGNVIADAHLYFANQHGHADLAFINEGSIRNDLPSGQRAAPMTITFGDLYATQPFGNELVSMQLSGAQISQLLQQQWAGKTANDPRKLFASETLSYTWKPGNGSEIVIDNVNISGQPLNLNQDYTVVANNFLADGGDSFSIFKQGRDEKMVGRDLDALEGYLVSHSASINAGVNLNRVQRQK